MDELRDVATRYGSSMLRIEALRLRVVDVGGLTSPFSLIFSSSCSVSISGQISSTEMLTLYGAYHLDSRVFPLDWVSYCAHSTGLGMPTAGSG